MLGDAAVAGRNWTHLYETTDEGRNLCHRNSSQADLLRSRREASRALPDQGLNRPPLMVPSNTAGETIKIDSVDRAMTRTAPNFDP
jgi:hypothetical protein